MIESNTSCKKVCATHDTIAWIPDLSAAGRLRRSKAVKAYAIHIDPTALVMSKASLPLNPSAASCTFAGGFSLRDLMFGCGICTNSMLLSYFVNHLVFVEKFDKCNRRYV